MCVIFLRVSRTLFWRDGFCPWHFSPTHHCTIASSPFSHFRVNTIYVVRLCMDKPTITTRRRGLSCVIYLYDNYIITIYNTIHIFHWTSYGTAAYDIPKNRWVSDSGPIKKCDVIKNKTLRKNSYENNCYRHNVRIIIIHARPASSCLRCKGISHVFKFSFITTILLCLCGRHRI